MGNREVERVNGGGMSGAKHHCVTLYPAMATAPMCRAAMLLRYCLVTFS